MAERWFPCLVKTAQYCRVRFSLWMYEPFRHFVSTTLKGKADFLILGEARDGLEAIQLAKASQPDLILLDIGLPKMNGIETARAIREVAPDARIVFLTQEASPEIVQEALGLGARGYSLKAQAEDELLRALHTVLLGGQFLSCGLRAQISQTVRTA